jgi:uroporphyrinogen decarboxylase
MCARFDEEASYAALKKDLAAKQAQSGDMLWCPADWEIIPTALWYGRYGYENALLLPRLHPDAHRKLLRTSAERGRLSASARARAIREGIHPKAILTGEDLCSQRGPMISPDLLKREYWPLVEYAIEPVLEAGGRLVWHCDGDVRPIIPDVLKAGFAGLQGFQSECGMDLEWIIDLRTRHGHPLLIFGPMSVTTVLPHGTPQDIRDEVNRAMRLCRDRASLVYFTSNTINPDVPLENLKAYFNAVLESHW